MARPQPKFCKHCDTSSEVDDSVQKRKCGCTLCEDCMFDECPICDADIYEDSDIEDDDDDE